MFGAQRQGLFQKRAIGNRLRQQDQLRRRPFVVELTDKGFQHFAGGKLARLAREERAVAPILSGAEEEHLHASLAALAEGREKIGFHKGGRIDPLRRLHLIESAQSIAQFGGALEIERVRGSFHVLRQAGLHRAALAGEKMLRFVHQIAVCFFVDAPNARRAAALDLEQ